MIENKWFFLGFLIGSASTLLLCIFISALNRISNEAELHNMRKSAVKSGAAFWKVDDYGNARLTWRFETELEVKP